jgi:hypothetical protein
MVVLALLGGAVIAEAQPGSTPPELQDGTVGRGDPTVSSLRLTAEQKTRIADSVRKSKKTVTPPPSFVAAVGAPVPPAIELYLLPDEVLEEVPGTKTVKYTMLQNQVVLVDPTTMRVVDIIPQP